MSALPYVTSPGNIEKALTGIKQAATPPNVTLDFVKTILKIPGGSGNQMSSYLKKIGFVHPDGSPSDIYKKYRNPNTASTAVADAMKIGYAPLKLRNEYWFKLPDTQLRGLIIEETGQGEDSNVVSLILNNIRALKKFASFDQPESPAPMPVPEQVEPPKESQLPTTRIIRGNAQGLGLNLSYTINLNLPATADIAVFNAIFKSLKENLLQVSDAGE